LLFDSYRKRKKERLGKAVEIIIILIKFLHCAMAFSFMVERSMEMFSA